MELLSCGASRAHDRQSRGLAAVAETVSEKQPLACTRAPFLAWLNARAQPRWSAPCLCLSLNVASPSSASVPGLPEAQGPCFLSQRLLVLIICSKGSNETLGQRPLSFIWLMAHWSRARQTAPCALEVGSITIC